MTGITSPDAQTVRRYAFLNGLDFDNQTDYCEPCRAYHLGVEHDEAVPDQCGSVGMWGHSVVIDCRREAGHEDNYGHRDIDGTSW